jgi:hypothetical protein
MGIGHGAQIEEAARMIDMLERMLQRMPVLDHRHMPATV